MLLDPFKSIDRLSTRLGEVLIYRLKALERAGLTRLDDLPYAIRVLLESVLRQAGSEHITEQDVIALAGWSPKRKAHANIPFQPMRVVMQDFTGVPAIVDLAAMRSALSKIGGGLEKINPRVPVDLIIDHSVQVDFFASHEALRRNAELEFQRNHERYSFLRWCQEAFQNFRVVPPATGIIHQVNLEFLASVVRTKVENGHAIAFPDTLIGTDSHTTMINGLGVVGWGVGGIEAEAAILGQPLVIPAPEVIGFRLTGALREGTNATDLVLTITEMLRKFGVVGKFVEFFGSGLVKMTLPDRATIANMAPEYGATMGYFPVDDETLRYLRLTGRSDDLIDLVERYCKAQGLFRSEDGPTPSYNAQLELDLAKVEPSLAGPKRPQDRIPLSQSRQAFRRSLSAPITAGGYALAQEATEPRVHVRVPETEYEIGHGAVVLAAITSCTNTSNPSVMIAAGLLAQKAHQRGLRVKPYVKTSLASGSSVVTAYLRKGGFLEPLAALGFNVVGYGCTTCIGNSGPLPGEVVKAISEGDLVATAVLSGNRNFEGRINPHVRANYLSSPPLIVAYALAGTIDIDLMSNPLGTNQDGNPVYLRDIWPTQDEIHRVVQDTLSPDLFRERYADVFIGNETWNEIPVSGGSMYAWDPDSTYIQEPPFFTDLTQKTPNLENIQEAHVLVLLGDSITTDHISPAGAIPARDPAGRYLIEKGVAPRDFNSYGSRRGNDRVMTRGTFGNIHLKNLLVPGAEGGVTIFIPTGEKMSIYEAAMKYQADAIPLIVLAGKEYGTGSSRDWAAKGTCLLGVRAVIAESYERIHRSNLIGMGVLPLEFMPGESVEKLGLSGRESYSTLGIHNDLKPGETLLVRAITDDCSTKEFRVKVRIDTPIEMTYYHNRGILHTVLRQMLNENGN